MQCVSKGIIVQTSACYSLGIHACLAAVQDGSDAAGLCAQLKALLKQGASIHLHVAHQELEHEGDQVCPGGGQLGSYVQTGEHVHRVAQP